MNCSRKMSIELQLPRTEFAILDRVVVRLPHFGEKKMLRKIALIDTPPPPTPTFGNRSHVRGSFVGERVRSVPALLRSVGGGANTVDESCDVNE